MSVSPKRFVLSVLLAVVVCACIDTALSLVVDVESASGDLGADTLSIEVRSTVRVGTYALAGDDFILPRATLFSQGSAAAEVVLERPEGFDGRLEPGEETTVISRGTSDLADYPRARELLCAGSDVTVLLGWQAAEQPDDPLDPPIMSFGNAEGVATIRCD